VEDIRQCRQDIMTMEDNALMMQLLSLADFYTVSECRDLIFHVHEHRHTIPRIKENLKELGLDLSDFRSILILLENIEHDSRKIAR